jgi:transketolase
MEKLIATRDAYGDGLLELGRKDSDFFVFDADLSCATKTERFAAEFPERFFQMGISEQDMMGTAAGAAAYGMKSFVSTFALFATGRAYEQIRNSIAYPNLNVKIAASHSGITVGPDGGSHQSIEDIALMRVVPNMKVVIPADAKETKQVIESVINIDGPFYIRLGRNPLPKVVSDRYKFEFGKIPVLREGNDITIAASGIMVNEALKAAELLSKEGIDIRVLNVNTVKPLDEKTILKAAKETNIIITAEEHSIIGGVGSAISEFLSEEYPVPVYKVGIKDEFGQSGSPEELMKHYNLTSKDLINKVKSVL